MRHGRRRIPLGGLGIGAHRHGSSDERTASKSGLEVSGEAVEEAVAASSEVGDDRELVAM
jgi:hypothetical protein